jgi:plastocyanin
MRTSVALSPVLAAALAMAGCGSSSMPSPAPTTPSATTTPAPGPAPTPTPTPPVVTVSIVGFTGSGSFVPNPVPAVTGDSVAWKNNDVTTHHIVLDNGSADLGDLAPGAMTRTITVGSTAALSFHCTIHPTMVGSIDGTAPAPGPSPSPYAARR